MIKTVHFVRHAQGEHNVAGERDRKEYLREDLIDAVLSDKGKQQCSALLDKLDSADSNHVSKDAHLLVVSPMRRTLETALLGFKNHVDRIPWVALESLREKTGLHPCDCRLSVKELQEDHPHVCFRQIESESDPLYHQYDTREPEDHINKRALDFFKWLEQREESNVIVVTHSAYLQCMFLNVLNVQYGEGEKFVWFENCEMRSFDIELPTLKTIPH